jgi:hypothetical protein
MAPPPKKQPPPPANAERNVEAEIAAYEGAIEQCRHAYERYFAGLEKREPQDLRKRCEALARALPEASIRNSGLKFRMQTARQRWTTYAQHWARVVKQIEEGTYKRDRDRAERRFASPSMPAPAPSIEELSGSDLLEDDDDDSTADLAELARAAAAAKSSATSPGASLPGASSRTAIPTAPSSRAVVPAAPSSRAVIPPSGPASAVDLATPAPPSSVPIVAQPRRDDSYRGVYERYVSERVRRGDAAAAGLEYEKVVAQLKSTEAQLKAKYAGRTIDFDVTEKDGKVVLKPIVK